MRYEIRHGTSLGWWYIWAVVEGSNGHLPKVERKVAGPFLRREKAEAVENALTERLPLLDYY